MLSTHSTWPTVRAQSSRARQSAASGISARSPRPGYPYAWLLRRSSYQISSFLVRRENVDAVGGFDPAFTAIDDLDFVYELWRRHELRLVDEPLT